MSEKPLLAGTTTESYVPVIPAKSFSHQRENKKRVDLTWSGINLTVHERKEDKHILRSVTGSLKTGELCCIMGPSGAGKSTLLNVLAGRVAASRKIEVEGNVEINGQPIEATSFRDELAYVMQEDALCPTATPREAIRFSARLRLPRSVSFEEQDSLVEDMIQSLGLAKCADTMIGGGLIKGISGGEKKRTAIGVELITNPSLLFLDEPTSGLDSYAAYNAVQVLKSLAAAGCAVLCTIHQPSSEVFHLFDRCILIWEGRIVYGGSVPDMVGYFRDNYGKECPRNYNPADFVMFIMQKESQDRLTALADKWDQKFLQQQQAEEVGLGETARSTIRRVSQGEMVQPTRASFATQLYYLSNRERLNLARDTRALVARFGMAAFLNLLYGIIFWKAAISGDSQTHFGALFQIVISTMMGASQPTLLTFPLERPIFLREYATGTYGIMPYFISKIVVELPLSFAQTSLSWLALYWLIRFQGKLMLLILVTWLFGLVSASTAILLGSLASNVTAAVQASPAIFVPQFLFAGFFIKIQQIPKVLRWVQYLCAMKFAMNLEMLVEFEKGGPGEQLLLDQNDVKRNLWWFYLAVLLALFIGFRTISLLALRVRARSFG